MKQPAEPCLDFSSDNVVGASAPVMAALAEAAGAGATVPYGGDPWCAAAQAMLGTVFERDVESHLVVTGTAANALALAALSPPWGGVLCHATAHIHEDELGAPEFFTGGAKLFGLAGPDGKITPDLLDEALARFPAGLRQVRPAALSLSQATECGTVYRPAEIAALAGIAHAAGLAVHMDGARFANALAAAGASAADMTWRAGVDILSFGATKNGALACEALVVFDPARLVHPLPVLRKRGGHILSKARLLGAQMVGYLQDDHWMANARQANAMAALLAEGLRRRGCRLPWTPEANELFVVMPAGVDAALKAAGAHYYPWDAAALPAAHRPGKDEVFVRLICSYATREADIRGFLEAAAR